MEVLFTSSCISSGSPCFLYFIRPADQTVFFFLSSANSDEYRDGKLDESIFRGIFNESDRPTQKKLFYCSLIIITNMQKKIKQAKID